MTDLASIAQTVSDLRMKALNLSALIGGLKLDLAVTPHSERADSLAYTADVHLAQTVEALGVLEQLAGKP